MLPKHVLAFEDVVFRNDLDRSLGGRKEIELKTARSGWEIVVSTSFVKPDLVILDHWLPDMLGDEVIDQMRRQQVLKDVPILLVAPGIGPAALNRCRKLGPVTLYKEVPDRNALMSKITGLLKLSMRRQVRIPLKIPVNIKSGSMCSFGVTRALSLMGATIETDLKVQPKSQLMVTFMEGVQGSCANVSTRAVVRHVNNRTNQNYLGVEFVEPSSELHDFLSTRIKEGQELAGIIGQIERLPTLPSMTSVVLEEMLKGGVNPKRMVSLIRSEPALTANLLKTANATAYRSDSPVTTVERALEQLNAKTVRNAMLGFGLFRHLEEGNQYNVVKKLWKNSVACGLFCELLAPRFGLDSEEAYTLGLLHDVGKIVLLSECSKDTAEWVGEDLDVSWSLDRERELFGMDHAEVGAAILSQWQIPECIHKVIAQHHNSQSYGELTELQVRFLKLLRMADMLVRSGQPGAGGEKQQEIQNTDVDLSSHETELLRQKVGYSLSKTEDAFGYRDETSLCTKAVELANAELSKELNVAQERNALLTRAYERTRQNLVSLVQGEKYHALGRILQGVSHEMNNPLGFILSNLNTLQEYTTSITAYLVNGSDAPDREELDEIVKDLPSLVADTQEGVLRVSSVVQALRHFHLEGNSRMASTNLRKCLEEAVALTKSSKPEGVTIELGPGHVSDTRVDHGGMVRVFVEIMLNAFAAMSMGGKLEIDIHEEPSQAVILLRDNGEGISEENIKHVFEPFFTTRSVGDGMGLGLSVAFGIVSKHQGQLLISSNSGQGTLVEVRLPTDTVW